MAVKHWTRDEIEYPSLYTHEDDSLRRDSGVLSYGRHHSYHIFVFNARGGPLIRMGCRLFTIEQAKSHWPSFSSSPLRGEFMLKLIPVIEFEARQLGWIKDKPEHKFKVKMPKRKVAKR